MFPVYLSFVCLMSAEMFSFIDAAVNLSNSTQPMAKARQMDDLHETTTALNRQWPESSFLVPNFGMSTLLPIAILIGIGVILLKLFILSLWIFGRSGTPLGGYGLPMTPYSASYPGYHSLSSAYTSGWRGDGSGVAAAAAARSMVDKNGFPVSPIIGNKLISLVAKVAEAIENVEKRYNHGSKL